MLSLIFNLVLWAIAFICSSAVIYIFVLIIQPLVLSIYQCVAGIFISPPPPIDTKSSLAAEGFLWIFDVVKAGAHAMMKLISKKRECSVPIFATEKACAVSP